MVDVVPNAGVITLGKQGENQAVRVTLPNIRAGAGSILLLHQRSDDQKPYPVPVVEADGGIIWTVSSTDTAYPGRGQAELQWLGADGAVVKSVTYQTNIIRALTAPGAVPDEPLKPYTQAVAKDAQAAKNAAASATEAARAAGASATQAGLSAENAANALKKLEDGIASGDFRGKDGKSAYQLAVDAGFDGTETQWLESLKGAPGDTTAADAAAEAAKKAAQEAQKAAEAAVLYTEQHLTDSQQEQARSNINAADGARQNILVGSETGNPIVVDDAFAAPLCGLNVYGKSTQDGTPTPDAPVPIVSAGDGGTISVKMTGKNLVDVDTVFAMTGEALTISNGHIKGTANNNGARIGYLLQNAPAAQYIASVAGGAKDVSTEIRVYIWKDGKFGNLVVQKTYQYQGGKAITIAFGADGKSDYAVWFRPNAAVDFDFYNVQLELGSTATAYSPYQGQLLTLPTPNGLPGIPVTSGGNYIDQNGQRWICDEIDLTRGVRVQRIDKTALDGTKTLSEQNAILATPIETPLTPAELAAYEALTTYAPDTVAQASDGAGVKLDYQRDVNIAIQRLEDAIASMTAT